MFSSLSHLRRPAEVRRAGDDDGIVAQRIDEHELVVDVEVVVEAGQMLAEEVLQVARLELRAGGDDRVADLVDLIFDFALRGSCRTPRSAACRRACISTSLEDSRRG